MNSVRRYDLDWLRVIVFGLLIFFHVGMFFVPWSWHIKNVEIIEWFKYPMTFLSQWRLSILFVISGMGTRFALSSRTQKNFLKERFFRLFLPLAFGMVIIVAPQVYIERIAHGDFEGTFFDFYTNNYFTGIYPSGNFSWHHLWFLPYLLIFSIVLSPIMIYFRNNPTHKFLRWIENLISKRFGLFAFLIPLIIVFIGLENKYPINHSVWKDWYALSFYGILFFYGFIFISVQEVFWNVVKNVRQNALVICFLSFFTFYFIAMQQQNLFRSLLYILFKFLFIGSTIIALFGYAAAYLNKNSKLLTYCNQAVYPFYIFHQTITVVVGYFLYKSTMHYGFKFLILTLTTFGGSWLLFELVKRTKITRFLFGIKAISKKVNKSVLLIFLSSFILISCSSLDNGNSQKNEVLEFNNDITLIIKNKEVFSSYRDVIVSEFEKGIQEIGKLLPLNNMTITVKENPNRIIPEIGFGGFNPNANEIIFSVDLNFNNLISSLQTEFFPLLAHEIHHAIRRRSVGYGNTLLEATVSEGLADHFSMEVAGVDPPIWAAAFNVTELQELIDLASNLWDDTNYNHDAWFFGRNSNISRWAGYSVGFEIIKRYLEKNPTYRASTLINTSANKFRP